MSPFWATYLKSKQIYIYNIIPGLFSSLLLSGTLDFSCDAQPNVSAKSHQQFPNNSFSPPFPPTTKATTTPSRQNKQTNEVST